MESAAHDELKDIEGRPQQGRTPLGAKPPQGCATRCRQALLVEYDQRIDSGRNGQLQVDHHRRHHVATVVCSYTLELKPEATGEESGGTTLMANQI